MKISPARVQLIGAACILMIAVSYMCFLAATWVQFQSDRANRMEKIDELLDRIPPRPDRQNENADAKASMLSVRDPDPVKSSNHSAPIRNEAGPVLRAMPEQTTQAPAPRNED